MPTGVKFSATSSGKAHGSLSVGFSLLAVCALAAGCTTPSQANIALRKENSQLQTRLDQLQTMRKADEARRGVTTAPSVAGAVDLDSLYTTHALSFGSLTGVTGKLLKAYITPLDQAGDTLKAAGGFEVSAFDHSRGTNALIGQWTFTPAQAAKAWNGKGFLFCYVLECPIEGAAPDPALDRKLTVRVVFRDTLTGRTIEAENNKARVFK